MWRVNYNGDPYVSPAFHTKEEAELWADIRSEQTDNPRRKYIVVPEKNPANRRVGLGLHRVSGWTFEGGVASYAGLAKNEWGDICP